MDTTHPNLAATIVLAAHFKSLQCQFRLSGLLDHCSAGEPPQIPHIMTNWHHGLHLEVVLLDVAHISDDMLSLPVSVQTPFLAAVKLTQ